MTSGLTCEVCGRRLPAFGKSFVCGDACRKRKSRLRLDAGKNLIIARNAMRDYIKGLELDVISTRDSYDEYQELQEMLRRLAQAHNARFDREMTERERQERE